MSDAVKGALRGAWAWACYHFVLRYPGNPDMPSRWWHPGRLYWAALPWAGLHAYGDAAAVEAAARSEEGKADG
jgi:hypothetical protein